MTPVVTGLVIAFLLGVALAKAGQRRPRAARRARRVAGWEAAKAQIADALLLLAFKGVYSRNVGLSNPTPTGDSPHQIRSH